MLPNKLSPSDKQHLLETGLSCSQGEQANDTDCSDSTSTENDQVESADSVEQEQSAGMQQSANHDASGALSQDSQMDADEKADSDHLQTVPFPEQESGEEMEDLYDQNHQMNTDNMLVFQCDWRNKLFPGLKRMGFPRRVPVCRAQVTVGNKTYTACVDSGASMIT